MANMYPDAIPMKQCSMCQRRLKVAWFVDVKGKKCSKCLACREYVRGVRKETEKRVEKVVDKSHGILGKWWHRKR